VIAGGTIPKQHVSRLKSAGVKEVFLPGSDLDSIVSYIGGLA
jgi:methylmalonyl-CoA mutase cobalamin-binding domain/chain